jgi:hypothetical protein
MHLFADRDLEAGHREVKPSASKEFIVRKTPTIASDKVQGTYWNGIKCKECIGNPPEAVLRQATINRDS